MTVLVLCVGAAGAEGPPQPDGFGPAVAAASRSLVRVRATFPQAESPFPVTAEEATFFNTGFFVGTDGEVLTSLLGVAGCRDISVTSPDGRTADARVVAMDQAAGLALLKAEMTGTEPFEFMQQAPEPGSWVLLTSARGRNGGVVAVGEPVLLHTRRTPVLLHGVEWRGLTAATARVPAGAAAAPLLDPAGRLAGVVLGVQWAAGTTALQDECLALPADQLAPIVARLSRGQSRRLGWLGLAVLREPGDREGVKVGAVLESTPAHAAGIRPGDVLLQIAADPIDGPAMFMRHVVECEPGTSMRLTTLRGDRMRTVTVEVGLRPLLICGAYRHPGAEAYRRSRRSISLPPLPLDLREHAVLQQVLQENERLRRRIEEIEQQLRQLEQQKD